MLTNRTLNNELRITPRVGTSTSISVFNQPDSEYLGELLNCSDGGLLISSYEALKPGTLLNLELVDVAPNIDTQRKGRCVAEVVWAKAITPSQYSAGCRVQGSCDMFDSMLKSYQCEISTNKTEALSSRH